MWEVLDRLRVENQAKNRESDILGRDGQKRTRKMAKDAAELGHAFAKRNKRKESSIFGAMLRRGRPFLDKTGQIEKTRKNGDRWKTGSGSEKLGEWMASIARHGRLE